MASCPVGKGAIIGSSVGAFLAGALITSLLGLYLGSSRLGKQHQEAVPYTTVSYASPEWRTELQETSASMARPGQIRTGNPKYEMGGQQVGSLRELP
jgi:hypothetical protein